MELGTLCVGWRWGRGCCFALDVEEWDMLHLCSLITVTEEERGNRVKERDIPTTTIPGLSRHGLHLKFHLWPLVATGTSRVKNTQTKINKKLERSQGDDLVFKRTCFASFWLFQAEWFLRLCLALCDCFFLFFFLFSSFVFVYVKEQALKVSRSAVTTISSPCWVKS